MRPNDYNLIAWCYDGLTRLVFGDKLKAATIWHLNQINPCDRVLILGGGTGEILAHFNPSIQITFVDMSDSMVRRAMTKGSIETTFICADFLEYRLIDKHDWVICPFFLDLFDEANMPKILDKIAGILSPKGRLLVSDFQNQSGVKGVLIKAMYLFFRITTNISTKHLPEINRSILANGFVLDKSHVASDGLLFSNIYAFDGNH